MILLQLKEKDIFSLDLFCLIYQNPNQFFSDLYNSRSLVIIPKVTAPDLDIMIHGKMCMYEFIRDEGKSDILI